MPALSTILAGATLAQTGIGLASKLLGPKRETPALPNLGRIAGQITASAAGENAANVSAIRQAGAANRLPAGATQSAIALASGRNREKTGRALNNLEMSKLPIAKFKSEIQEKNIADFNNSVNFSLEGLGTLGKIAVLSKMGYLDIGSEDNQDPFGSDDVYFDGIQNPETASFA